MTYGRHPYYQTPRDDDREAFQDDIDRLMRETAPRGVREGVRVLDDGTVEHYAEVL